MATFECTHPALPRPVVRRLVRWVCGQIGLPNTRGLTIIVGPKRRQHRGYNGWYRHHRRRVEAYVGELITYPIDVGHNRLEADWFAADPFELLVYLLAHELEHARVYRAVYPNRAKLVVLNHEPRVRAVGYRAVLVFREHREALLAEWTAAATWRPRPAADQKWQPQDCAGSPIGLPADL